MAATSACPYTENVGTVMSNFDHEIVPEVAAMLDGEVCADYSGWEFHGTVWRDKDSGLYRCEVWRYHFPQEVLEAPTLPQLMSLVCDRWGWE